MTRAGYQRGVETTGRRSGGSRGQLAVGAEIGQRDGREIGRAKQLVLPIVAPQNIPKMYVLVDGVQVPVVAAETEGRTGRMEGQRARTREYKLGCVFTQTTVDKEGWPIRGPASTTYVGAIEIAEQFGFRMYTEAWKRGWEWAIALFGPGIAKIMLWAISSLPGTGARPDPTWQSMASHSRKHKPFSRMRAPG